MDKTYCWVFCLLLCALSMGATPVYGQHAKPTVADSVLDTALWSIGLTQADLSIRGDILGDADRFEFTQRLLEEPARSRMLLPDFSQITGTGLLYSASQMMDSEPTVSTVFNVSRLKNVPEVLSPLIQALSVCQKQLDDVFKDFSTQEKETFKSLIHLVDPGVALSEAQSDSLIALGQRVNRQALVTATARLMESIDVWIASSPTPITGDMDTPIGRVVVGTRGKDVYDQPAVLIIDLGGDDHYVYQKEATHLSVVIDLSGNDLYEGASGSGIGGVCLTIDIEGQDRYLSDGVGQGVGMGGVGVLIDLEGDDFYQADVGGQGLGLYGVGILCDRDGDDQYAGALLVQGVGAPGGVGILADALGDDIYRAGGKYKDFREEGLYDQSMAQGFGYGVRPLVSGGVGVLIDREGADRYQVDYFGQGAGFWGSVGILIDYEGKDQFNARRYAQGCGVHLAVGLLIEENGHDIYDLWGVGQGAGHDLGVGKLIDLQGHDIYRSSWLAQGIGSANGVGWLDDFEGDDHFYAEREDTQGFGRLARDYGSIGLLIDRAGIDHYRLERQNGLVGTQGDYGVRIDWPLLGRTQ